MRGLVLGPLLFLVTSAAVADTHLYPLDLGIAHWRNAGGEKWLDSLDPNDVILVEFDVFPTFNSPKFVGILKPHTGDAYTLSYFEDSLDKAKAHIYRVPVPAKFGDILADKVEKLIRADTHYDQDDNNFQPLDASDWFFRSRLVSATAYNGREGGVPKQLVLVSEKLQELAKRPPTDQDKRQQLMDETLKLLE